MIDWKKAARGFLTQRNNVERVLMAIQRRLGERIFKLERALAFRDNRMTHARETLRFTLAAMQAMRSVAGHNTERWQWRIKDAMLMLGWEAPTDALHPGYAEDLLKAVDGE